MIDDLDFQIIDKLSQDGRQSSESLASLLKSSSTSIKRRIKQLIDNNIIRVTAVVNPGKVGFKVSALIAVDVNLDKLEEAVEKLVAQPEVRWLTVTTGRFDMMFFVRFRTEDELSDFLQKRLVELEGIKDTETFVCLREEKLQYVQMGELLE